MSNRKELEQQEAFEAGLNRCADWGALLPEAAEDLLGEAESKVLALHLAGCPSCEAELAEARRGAAWLSLLKDHTPEPSHDLVAGILARTSGAPTLANPAASELIPVAVPAWPIITVAAAQPSDGREAGSGMVRGWIARWFGLDSYGVPVLQPRLTMTAAMAFLSICLTLNLLGISVTRLHAQDLHAIHFEQTVAGKGASVLRSLQGIRVVYRVESRVNDWLTASNVGEPASARQ